MTPMPVQPSQPFEPDHLARLRTRVEGGAAVPLDAPPDDRRSAFAAWWLQTARLAVLGDDASFRTWPSVAKRLEIDAVEAIAEAARHGVPTLGDGAGEPLAEAIIDAEDAGCLLEAESRSTALLPALAPIIEAWQLAAAEAVPDEDAAEILREHAAAWPLPADLRLPAVEIPLTDLELLAAGVSRAAWAKPMRLAPVFEFEESLALFHDGRPTEAMCRHFAARRGEGVTPAGSMLRVVPQLDEFWGVVVEVTGAAARRVRSVRIGSWPLRRVEDVESASSGSGWSDGSDESDPVVLFEAVIANLPFAARMRLIRSDIGISTDDGGRFLL